MKQRTIWTRGLTPRDRGKSVEFKGENELHGILHSVEHYGNGSVVTMLVSVDIPHNVEVEVTD